MALRQKLRFLFFLIFFALFAAQVWDAAGKFLKGATTLAINDKVVDGLTFPGVTVCAKNGFKVSSRAT